MISVEGFTGIRAFVQAVEAGSFSAAARQLGQSPSSVGKAIARLEQRLEVRLLQRTTRRLALTDEGAAYHESCVRALQELERAQSGLVDRRALPSGCLRIALPVLLGRQWVVPLLLGWARAYPALDIEAVFSSHPVDFAEGGFDLAVRIGTLEDSASLVARRIGKQRLVTCAAPAYLNTCAPPRSLADLPAHACLGVLRDGRVEAWRFVDTAGQACTVNVKARLRLADREAVAAAASAGLGLAQLPQWLIAEALARGELVAVLPDHEPAPLPIHVVWPASRTLPARVRMVVDGLLAATLPGHGHSADGA